MKILPESISCRYWGYETKSAQDARSGTLFPEEREVNRQAYQSDRFRIKQVGLKPSQYGMKKSSAVAMAEAIENKTGIQMVVFTHDYL